MKTTPRTKWKIKKGDTVLALVGKDRGKTGKVLAVLPKEGRLVVENMNIVKKHVRARRAGEKGQRIEIPAPMPMPRVMLLCPACGKATRVGVRRSAGEGVATRRERVCKKCSAVIV